MQTFGQVAPSDTEQSSGHSLCSQLEEETEIDKEKARDKKPGTRP